MKMNLTMDTSFIRAKNHCIAVVKNTRDPEIRTLALRVFDDLTTLIEVTKEVK